MITELQPNGDRAEKSLDIELDGEAVKVRGDYAHDASAVMDWYNDRLQILVCDGQFDDPAVHVRLNPDGSVAEIIIRDDLWSVTGKESRSTGSAWQKERDGE